MIFVEPELEGVTPYIAQGIAVLRFKTPGFGTTEDGESVLFSGSEHENSPPDPPFVGEPGQDGIIPPERIEILQGQHWEWLVPY